MKKFWPFFLLTFITLIFFHKTVLFGKIPFPGDLMLSEYAPFRHTSYGGYVPGSVPSKAQYFDVARELYPWKHLVIEELKKGSWPLWNPYNFSGAPLLANYQSAVFYPLSLLYFILPFVTAWAVLIILQPLLGSLFMYLFATEIGISTWGALIAAITFNFGSFANVWMEFNTVWHTILWLPLMLFLVERSVREKRTTLFRMAVFVFALFSAITAGHPQDFLYTFIFLWIYSAFRLFSDKTLKANQRLPIALSFGGAAVFAFALASPQLLPTIELFGLSSRVPHDPVFVVEKILVQPWQLIMLFIQDAFGNPATKSYFPSDTYVGKTLSIGVIGMLLACIAVFTRKRTWHHAFFLASAVSVLLLTVRNPITALLYNYPIPIFSTGSPTRILFLLILSLAILAGFGLDEWRKNSQKLLHSAITVGSLLLFVALIGLVARKFPIIHLAPDHAKTMLRAAIFSTFFFATSVAVLIFLRKKNTAPIALFILVCAELLYGFLKFNPFVPPSFVFPDNHLFTFLEERHDVGRSWGYGTARLDSNLTTYYRLFSPDGTDPLNLAWYNAFIQSSQDGNVARAFTRQTRSDANISPGYGETDLPTNVSRLRVLDTLGVKYIVDRIENPRDNQTFPGDRYTQIYDTDGWKVFFNKKAAERYFLTNKVLSYNTTEEFEKHFFSPSFDPTSTVLIKNAPKEMLELRFAKEKEIKLISYEPTRVVFSTTTSGPQLLFLSDTDAPGWKTFVDHKETPLYRANYAFRAIRVPQGTHTATFEYKPMSFERGTWISLGAIFGGILFLGIGTFKEASSVRRKSSKRTE